MSQTILKDYLAQKAKFYVPPSHSSRCNSSSISREDAALLEPSWHPEQLVRDAEMVDSACRALDEYLGQRVLGGIPGEQFDQLFEPLIEQEIILPINPLRDDGERDILGMKSVWCRNDDKTMTMNLLRDGMINALRVIAKLLLRSDVSVLERTSNPISNNFASKVDFIIKTPSGILVIDVKTTAMLESVESLLSLPGFRIDLLSGASLEQKVINKASLHVALHHARWLALSSHEKWIFMRFHPDEAAPFISYSTSERQANNTKPFRALFAMLLDAEGILTIESKARPLPLSSLVISAGEQRNPSRCRGKFKDSRVSVSRTIQSIGRMLSARSELLIRWSQDVVENDKWTKYSPVKGTDGCSLLVPSGGQVYLCLRRLLGSGETGVVYEAGPDPYSQRGLPSSLGSFAIKLVPKGEYEMKAGRIGRLFNEFRTYQAIERARHEGTCPTDLAVPRCYGMYESEYSLALFTDYSGKALSEEEWVSLSARERAELFKSITALHAIGILHSDTSPQNILRRPDGSLCLIDFSEAELHECSARRKQTLWKTLRSGTDHEDSVKECEELNAIRRTLLRNPRQ